MNSRIGPRHRSGPPARTHLTTHLEAEIIFRVVVEARRDAPEVLKPGEQSLDPPPAPVAPERSAVLRRRFLPVRLVRRDHLDASPFEFRVERVGVVSLIADQPLRLQR